MGGTSERLRRTRGATAERVSSCGNRCRLTSRGWGCRRLAGSHLRCPTVRSVELQMQLLSLVCLLCSTSYSHKQIPDVLSVVISKFLTLLLQNQPAKTSRLLYTIQRLTAEWEQLSHIRHELLQETSTNWITRRGLVVLGQSLESRAPSLISQQPCFRR